jgi:hypothetical protein
MRITLVALALLLTTSNAWAAARAVLLPVVVGNGGEPSGDLMSALAKGLQDNPGWQVIDGGGLKGLMVPPAGLKDEDRKRLGAKLEEASAKKGKEAVADLEAVRTELATAAKDMVLIDADHDLNYRAAGLLVAALAASGDAERAKAVAIETAAEFPGRKPRPADKLPASASELLASAVPTGGVKVTFKSRPEGCEVFVNGASLGKAPAEIMGSPVATYQAHAVCPGNLRSYPKRVFLGDKETARNELLDAEFERSFEADGGQRLRFASSQDRRAMEDAFARRVAERYGADAVILASVGELSGADWLNGRLYLSSGYLNRQALVRLEAGRATALGRFLATGKDSPGVLKPEEASQLVASSQANAQSAAKGGPPWYTDVVGWSLTGVGAIGIVYGLIEKASGQRTSDKADTIRPCGMGNPNPQCGTDVQMALYRDAEHSKFLGDIGLIGGGLMAVTGIVLLAIPEYNSNQSELFVLRPTKGGGLLSVSGKF